MRMPAVARGWLGRTLTCGPVPVAAAVAAVASALIALVQRGAISSPRYEVVAAVVAVSPWLVERLTPWRFPAPLFALAASAGVAVLLLDPPTYDFAPFILVVMAAEIGVTTTPRQAVALTAAAAATMVALDVAGRFPGSGVWVAGVAAGLGFGAFVQLQLRLVDQARQTQETHAQAAALEERRRIAREVHDVVAHSLSVTMLHLTGARHVLASRGDIDEALAALHEAERAGRQSVADIRRTVGLLGPTPASPAPPEPAAADIAQLVVTTLSAGLDVDYEVVGDIDDVPPATGLGLYRIVQESLANAARHAPGAKVSIRLEITDERVALAVRNGHGLSRESPLARTEGGGMGLRGMRERGALLGGTVWAGPAGDAWVVHVVVPREAARA